MAEPLHRTRPVMHVSKSCSLPPSTFTSNTSPFVATLISSDRSLKFDLRALINSAAPQFALESLEPVPSIRPHSQYLAAASDGDTLALSLSPKSTRLLRSEHSPIHSELVLLRWLSAPTDRYCPVQAQIVGQQAACVADEDRHNTSRFACTCTVNLIQSFLPKLIGHGSARHVGHSEYLLTRPVKGITLASLPRPLAKAERKCVDFQVGQLLRRISSLKAPQRKFGTAVALLALESVPHGSPWKRGSTPDLNSRHDRWSDAFLSLLESALRDAEDFRIAIRYEAIRDHVRRFRHLLDAVTSPRLVAVDAGEDGNTLVSAEAGHLDGDIEWNHTTGCQPYSQDPEHLETSMESDNGSNPLDEDQTSSAARRYRVSLKVTGIREWSSCIFGDPLFASVLSRNASPDIWDGFKKPASLYDTAVCDSIASLLEDSQNAEVRRLLYECHHAVTAIVREYCRRRSDSDDREMPARKRLMQVLRKLDNIDDAGMERHPHLSGEMSPAKRPRSDCESGEG